MTKKIIAAALAAVMAAGLGSCGSSGSTLTVIQKTDSQAAVTEAPEVSVPETTDAPADSSGGETTAAPVSSEKETAAITTTAAPVKKDPVPVEINYIYNSKAWFSKVNQVTDNDELKKELDKLDDMINRYGMSLSFAYQNLDNDVMITYNTNKQFETCSTIKAPYAKSLLESGISLDDEVTITDIYTDAAPEEGHLTYADAGKTYTVRKLMENAISLSDNTAHMNLIKKYGRYTFNAYEARIGAKCYIYEGYYFAKCTAYDMLLNYKDIYDYSKQDENGKFLLRQLIDSTFDYQISDALSSKYQVAHKYGSDQLTKSYHDCAICLADSPYVLCIFTEQTPETEAANNMFHELAEIFDHLNELIVS